MKCHYEILGIARDADDSEIKTAYRKLALKWHPDKNLDNPDEAKEQFQLVQQAYEVLSDPHERGWYDNHREQILRGRNSNYEDNCLDVFQYFSVSCFKGYGDNKGGFYQIYADVFERIASEDAEFMDEDEFENIPKFGNSESNYEEIVGPFYAYWQSYCTKRSYTWLCPYNISEIKDRRILRAIEKEMKKIVQKAKRERNEEVRNLVSFVRKRDKRVQAYKKYLEEKAAINRQKQEQNRLEQIRRRKNEIEEFKKSQKSSTHLNSGDYEQQLKLLEQEYYDSDEDDYTDSDEDMNELNDDENNLVESTNDLKLNENEQEYDNLYCVACNKQFKNPNAYQNHEISKKHRENVEKLIKKLNQEESGYLNTLKLNEKETEISDENSQSNYDDDEHLKQYFKENTKRNKKSKSKRIQNVNYESNDSEIEENVENLKTNFNTHLKENSDDDNVCWDDRKLKKSKGKKSNQHQQKNIPITTSNNLDSTSLNQNEIIISAKKSKDKLSDKSANNLREDASNGIDLNHVCVTCKSSFESKNKLFQHLKKTGHGVYIPKSETNNVGSGTTNRKGKKCK